jgi:hypothetical protein
MSRVGFDYHVRMRVSHFEATRPGNVFFGESQTAVGRVCCVFESLGERGDC